MLKTPYFLDSDSGVAITSGDFDGDGDLDLVTLFSINYPHYRGVLQYYENDGKGNFTLRYYDNQQKPTEAEILEWITNYKRYTITFLNFLSLIK